MKHTCSLSGGRTSTGPLPSELIKRFGKEINSIVESLIELGTDISYETIKHEPFLAVVQIAIQVVLLNVGPELQSFLANDLKAIRTMLQPVPITTEARRS